MRKILITPYIEALSNMHLSRSGDRAPRYPAVFRVHMSDGETHVEALSINISRSGLLLDISSGRWPQTWHQEMELTVEFGPVDKLVKSQVKIRAFIVRFCNAKGSQKAVSVGDKKIARQENENFLALRFIEEIKASR